MLRSTLAPAVAAVLLVVAASSASAQVIYEPVRYQHGETMKYYYGGSNPAMHDYADRVACRNGYPSSGCGTYTSLYMTVGQIGEHRLVLSDCMPLRNAAVFGYTANDARNEAYCSVPRYFRKSELLEAAVPAGDGTLVVSAHATPRPATAARDTREAKPAELKPRAILILPKKGLKREHDTKAVMNKVASAN